MEKIRYHAFIVKKNEFITSILKVLQFFLKRKIIITFNHECNVMQLLIRNNNYYSPKANELSFPGSLQVTQTWHYFAERRWRRNGLTFLFWTTFLSSLCLAFLLAKEFIIFWSSCVIWISSLTCTTTRRQQMKFVASSFV